MFTLSMIIMSITANLGLIAIAALLIVTAIIAAFGEKWLEAFVEKHPWWMEEQDFSPKAIWNRHKK